MEIQSEENLQKHPSVKKMRVVTKRNGQTQEYDVKKIRKRLEKLCFELDMNFVDLDAIVHKVEQGLYDGIKTTEIDNLAAETAAYMNILHPHYSLLAARIAVDNLHKETKDDFFETIDAFYHYKDKTGK